MPGYRHFGIPALEIPQLTGGFLQPAHEGEVHAVGEVRMLGEHTEGKAQSAGVVELVLQMEVHA